MRIVGSSFELVLDVRRYSKLKKRSSYGTCDLCIWKKRDDELQAVAKVQKQRGSSRDGFQEVDVGTGGLKRAGCSSRCVPGGR